VHANSDISYSVSGCPAFLAHVGVDDEVGTAGSVVFDVWADGTRLFTSGLMTGSDPAENVSLNISNKTSLRLVVTDAGDINSDHADWADARLICSGGTATTKYLSDLTPSLSTNGWGPVKLDRSNGEHESGDGRTLTVNGATYPKGLGVHANSEIRYALAGRCTSMTATVGVDDEVGSLGSVLFEIWATVCDCTAAVLWTAQRRLNR
jgi:alpha-galactosidase